MWNPDPIPANPRMNVIIWLGELPLQELTYKLKTVPNAIAIGRLRTKLGLRFQQAHLEEATKALKPEEPYIETQVHQIYKLYPLPYGTQKAALQKCLTDWGWMARVRQSMGGGSAGVAWEVGSSKEPPSTILPQPSGDVAITLIRTVGKTDAPPALLASANTKKFMQKAQPTATTSDPWTHPGTDPWSSNPWGNYHGPSSSAPRASDKMQQLEDRLKQQMTAHIAASTDATMSQDHPEFEEFRAETQERMAKMESSMQELQAQGQKFEGWFTHLNQADQHLAAQLDITTQQVETQGHRIEQINKDMNQQVGTLQTGLNKVQTDLDSGFNRIEALLEKRNRTS